MADYSYQSKLVLQAYSALTVEKKKTVLCGTPGSGKTHMGLDVIHWLLGEKLQGPVLVLTHGQLILRNQWADAIKERKFDGVGVIESGKDAEAIFKSSRVILALPQTLRNANVGRIGALVVDEAHQRYFSDEVQELIERLQPQYQLLLTGTPSPFLRDDQFKCIGITIEELLDFKVLTDPVVEIVQTDYRHTYRDYDPKTGELRKGNHDAVDTFHTLDYMLPQLVKKLISRKRTDPDGFDWLNNTPISWDVVARRLHKTMIICHNQRHARDVHKYFTKKGVKAVMSISDMGDGGDEAEAFKKDPSVRVFIVVQRGILGFNYTELMNVIDLSGSINVNRIFQALCRVVRVSKKYPKQRKLFIKGTSREMAPLTYHTMCFTMALSTREYYFGYSTHMKLVKAPVDPAFLKIPVPTGRHSSPDRPLPDIPAVMTFSELKWRMQAGTVAYTDFATTLNRIYGTKQQWTDAKALAEARLIAAAEGKRKDFQMECPGAYSYLFVNDKLHLLDGVFGKRKRWDLWAVKDAMIGCSSLGQFRAQYPGAFQWIKRHKRLDLIEKHFGKREGSELIIKRTNSSRYILNNKIDANIARRIRAEYQAGQGKITYMTLSRRYNLAKSTISDLIQNKIWKTV